MAGKLLYPSPIPRSPTRVPYRELRHRVIEVYIPLMYGGDVDHRLGSTEAVITAIALRPDQHYLPIGHPQRHEREDRGKLIVYAGGKPQAELPALTLMDTYALGAGTSSPQKYNSPTGDFSERFGELLTALGKVKTSEEIMGQIAGAFLDLAEVAKSARGGLAYKLKDAPVVIGIHDAVRIEISGDPFPGIQRAVLYMIEKSDMR